MFRLLILIVILPVALYYFFYFRRTAKFWKLPVDKWPGKLGLLGATVLILLPLRAFSGLPALMVLLMFGMGLIPMVLNLFLKKAPFWQKAYGSGLIPVALTLLLVIFGWFNMHTLHRTDYTVESEKLTEPVRVIFISDLHYPNAMTPQRLAQSCEELSALEGDVLLLGGDIFDEGTEKEELEECLALLGSVETTWGTYAVYGNHDRSFYSDSPNYTPTELARAMEKNAITVLQDSVVTLGELIIMGREDVSRDRASMAELLAGVEPSQFLLVLDHQPRGSEENAALGCDLMLSGHTHNGQIWPIGFINALIGPRYGEYTFGKMKTIVSSGMTGWAYPIRTQGICEYVVVDLVPNP